MADKKISINKLDSLLKAKQFSTITTSYEISEHETIEILVKRYIDLTETIGLVNGVVNSAFQIGEDGVEFYAPEILDYTKALHYIEYFCPTLKTDIGADRIYSMLYSTKIMSDIYSVISPLQYDHLEASIDNAIKHKLAIIQSEEKAKLAEATDKIDKASKAFEELTKIFEGIGTEKMQSVFDRVANMDTKELVGAVVDAQIPRDSE